MRLWDVYARVYGRLAGWKSANWFYGEKSRLISGCVSNLSRKKEGVLDRDKLVEMTQAEFDSSRKIAATPIMHGDVLYIACTFSESSSLEKNLQEQIAYLNSGNFNPRRFLELVGEEEKILVAHREKLIPPPRKFVAYREKLKYNPPEHN